MVTKRLAAAAALALPLLSASPVESEEVPFIPYKYRLVDYESLPQVVEPAPPTQASTAVPPTPEKKSPYPHARDYFTSRICSELFVDAKDTLGGVCVGTGYTGLVGKEDIFFSLLGQAHALQNNAGEARYGLGVEGQFEGENAELRIRSDVFPYDDIRVRTEGLGTAVGPVGVRTHGIVNVTQERDQPLVASASVRGDVSGAYRFTFPIAALTVSGGVGAHYAPERFGENLIPVHGTTGMDLTFEHLLLSSGLYFGRSSGAYGEVSVTLPHVTLSGSLEGILGPDGLVEGSGRFVANFYLPGKTSSLGDDDDSAED